jgi:hypothetical protein
MLKRGRPEKTAAFHLILFLPFILFLPCHNGSRNVKRQCFRPLHSPSSYKILSIFGLPFVVTSGRAGKQAGSFRPLQNNFLTMKQVFLQFDSLPSLAAFSKSVSDRGYVLVIKDLTLQCKLSDTELQTAVQQYGAKLRPVSRAAA